MELILKTFIKASIPKLLADMRFSCIHNKVYLLHEYHAKQLALIVFW